MAWEWKNAGSSLSVEWLRKYPAGGLPPPDESTVRGKSFVEITETCVRRIHASNGGLGIPNAFLYWHWAMVGLFLSGFLGVFFLTTPVEVPGRDFPWLTLVQKLIIWFGVWESLGLGAIHGPLAGQMKPPFIDWWYRFTPGTLKYNAPFMPFLPHFRNLLDVLVEGPLTYGLALRCLCAPTLTAELIQPLALCGIYELFFDYGQHLSSYGTQNLHCLICMCFSEAEGQVVGMQLFLVWFYVCSGWCKIGPWFKYLNISNLMTAKFMVGRAWSSTFRRLAFHDAEASVPDFRLTRAAALFSVACALGEVAGPLLCLSNSKSVVWLGIFFICCMHLYIVATLVIDVFSWNVADAIWCTVLFGVLRTGLDWGAISSMSPWLAGWLLLHVAYVIYGHFVPDQVTYVLAHRHAAGNFCQGVLLIRKTAAWKLGKLKAHSSNVPTAAESWAEEWFGFYSLFAYLWSWNLPSKMLLPIVEDLLSTDNLEEIMLLNSVPFFEGIMGHLRFDGLSSLKLVSLLGQVCDFEEGECRLAWVGAFPSFPAQLFGTPTASWKVVDSKVGVLKEGTFDTKSLEDPEYRRPSDCHCLRGLLRERRCEDSYRPPLLLTSAFQAGAIKTGWINDTPKFRR